MSKKKTTKKSDITNVSQLSTRMLNITLVRSPKPRNFKSGNVSLSQEEVDMLREGYYKYLTVTKYGTDGDILYTTKISQSMIDSVVDKGNYFLMPTK